MSQTGRSESWNHVVWWHRPLACVLAKYVLIYHKKGWDGKSLFFEEKDGPFQRGKRKVEDHRFLQSIPGLSVP